MAVKLSRDQPSAMEFDGRLLIREVKKRPLLYEKVVHDYSNLAERRKAWVEICETLVKGWDKWDVVEKERAIFLATKRWQNMRNCFLRELKAQKNEEGAPNPRRRKYYYYDDMLFLVGENSADNKAERVEYEPPQKGEESEISDNSSEDNEPAVDIATKRLKYNKFDTIDLIEAVKVEPAIYDKALEQTSKIKDERKDAWNRIGNKIYGAQWKKWKSRERGDAVDLLKIRWNNLRTCFMRELKLKKKQPRTNFSNKRRREYIYFKPLKFLLAHCEGNERSKVNVEYQSESESDNAEYLEEDVDDDGNEEEEDSDDYFEASSSRKSANTTKVKREKVEVVVSPTNDPLQQQYDVKHENIDQDLNFALSLVPMMRELSATRKLEVQIEILRLFKNVSSKNVHAVSDSGLDS